LTKYCKGMTSLNVSDCKTISDYSLLAISEGELVPGLKTLSLKGTQVTDTGITWLAERCTTLMNLNVTKCGTCCLEVFGVLVRGVWGVRWSDLFLFLFVFHSHVFSFSFFSRQQAT
jgi:hypothetical protein